MHKTKFKVLEVDENLGRVTVEYINLEGLLEKTGKTIEDFKIPIEITTGDFNDDGTPVKKVIYNYPDNINNNIILTLEIPFNKDGTFYNGSQLLKYITAKYPFETFLETNKKIKTKVPHSVRKMLVDKTFTEEISEENKDLELLQGDTPIKYYSVPVNITSEKAFNSYLNKFPKIPLKLVNKFIEEINLNYIVIAPFIRPKDGAIVGTELLNLRSNDSWNCFTNMEFWREDVRDRKANVDISDVTPTTSVPLVLKTYRNLSEKYGIPNIVYHEFDKDLKYFVPFVVNNFDHIAFPISKHLTWTLTKYTPIFAKNYKYQMIEFDRYNNINNSINYNNKEYSIEVIDMFKSYKNYPNTFNWNGEVLTNTDIENIMNIFLNRLTSENDIAWNRKTSVDAIYNGNLTDNIKITEILKC